MVNIEGLDKAELLTRIFNYQVEHFPPQDKSYCIDISQAKLLLENSLYVGRVGQILLDLDFSSDTELDDTTSYWTKYDPDWIKHIVDGMRREINIRENGEESKLLTEIKVCDSWIEAIVNQNRAIGNLIYNEVSENYKAGFYESDDASKFRGYLKDKYVSNLAYSYLEQRKSLEKRLIDLYLDKAVSLNSDNEIVIIDESAFKKLGCIRGNEIDSNEVYSGYRSLAKKFNIGNEEDNLMVAYLLENYLELDSLINESNLSSLIMNLEQMY
ncbi:MAG: hypothetical protein K2J20_00445, partial [Bacilli bacterium]|nr:hypothetical protein [Bacilli bacterium]